MSRELGRGPRSAGDELVEPAGLVPSIEDAEEELHDLLRQTIGDEPPPATSDAIGLEDAWRAVERDGRGEWLLASLERVGPLWEVTAVHRYRETILVVGHSPSLALYRLARTLRRST